MQVSMRLIATLLSAGFFLAGPLLAGPTIEATLFDRTVVSGELVSITDDQIQLNDSTGMMTLSVADLRSIEIPSAVPSLDLQYSDPPMFGVQLIDGSSIGCNNLGVSRKTATLKTESLGVVETSIQQVRAFRTMKEERDVRQTEVDRAWGELLARDFRFDLLVVRKGDILDFVEGTAGDITDTTVSFLLGEKQVSLPRERLYGLIYARGDAATPTIDAEVAVARDQLQVQRLAYNGESYAVTLNGGTSLRVGADLLHEIRYVGRVRFLDEMEPAVVYPPRVQALQEKLAATRDATDRRPIETDFKLATMSLFRKNTAPNGDRLQVGSDQFSPDRGIWLHSGVSATYRVNRDYRRIAAVVGMDHNSLGDQLSPLPRVRLVILADRMPIFDEVLEWTGVSRVVELPIEGVRDLEFRAERVPGAPPLRESAEHVSLGNLRVLK